MPVTGDHREDWTDQGHDRGDGEERGALPGVRGPAEGKPSAGQMLDRRTTERERKATMANLVAANIRQADN